MASHRHSVISPTASRPSSGASSRPESASSRRQTIAGSANIKRTSISGVADKGHRNSNVGQHAGGIKGLGGSRGKHNMTEEMKKEVMDTFHLLDDLHEGSIAGSKLLIALKIFGFEPTAAASERSKGSPIDLNEYMSFVLSCCSSQSAWCLAEMTETFSLFDREQCGYIAAAQFKRTFGRLGEKLTDAEIEEQMEDYDINDDNFLDMQGYYKMMLSNENR